MVMFMTGVITDYINYKRVNGNENSELIFPKGLLLEFRTPSCGFATRNKIIDNKICISMILPLKKKIILIDFEIPFEVTDKKMLSFLKDIIIDYNTNWFRIYIFINSKNLIRISISTENKNNFELINEIYQDENYIKFITMQVINYYLGQKLKIL